METKDNKPKQATDNKAMDKRHDFEASFLNKDNPLDRMTKFVSRTVKKETGLIKLLILSMFSTYTPDPINLGIEGPPGEGKTHPVVEVAQLFPEQDVMMLGGLSPTALVHDHGILIDGKGEPLLPKLEEKYQELDEETDKDKKEKIKREISFLYENAIRLINLKGKILIFLESPNRDTWSKLRPILSHDVYETTFKFTDRIHKNGPMTTVTVIMRGWPAVIYTSADAKSDSIWNQIKSRFLIVSPEMGENKYMAAIKLLGESKGIPKPKSIYKKELEDLLWCKKYIMALRNGLRERLKPFYKNYGPKDVNITWIPYHNVLIDEFPKTKGQRMRDFANFLRVLQTSAIINCYDRPIVTIEDDRFIIITMEDIELVRGLLNRSTVFSRQGQHIIDFHKDIIMSLWEVKEEDSDGITVHSMVSKCKEQGSPKSADTIRKNYLKPLVDDGTVSIEKDVQDKRRYIVKVLKTEISDDVGFLGSPINFSADDFDKAIEALNQYRIEFNFYNSNFFEEIDHSTKVDSQDLYKNHLMIRYTNKCNQNPLPSSIPEKYRAMHLSAISGICLNKEDVSTLELILEEIKRTPIIKAYPPNSIYSHKDYHAVVDAISYYSNNDGAYWDSVIRRAADTIGSNTAETEFKIKSIMDDGLVKESPPGYLKLDGGSND